ncbi:hypothetical protein ACFXGI_33265 [Streptomyces sp. NPDC059355]|uniref:hypothetical protein n=1 Tax=Streptomyces sp. NPDC059355 TaxID=3346811 RepID=UPI0036C6FC9D
MNGPSRPALVGVLIVSMAGLFPAAHAVAASPTLVTAACTAAAGPSNTVTLTVSGFSGDMRVTETGSNVSKIIHKGTPTISMLPPGNYVVEWSNAPTPAESQRTTCVGDSTTTNQGENQYSTGFQQGLKETLATCQKNAPKQLAPDPNWQAGYDKGAATALNSKRCTG